MDVWTRRTAEQAARDMAHTQRMVRVNRERIEAEFAAASELAESMPRDVEAELCEADDERAEEERESWECAGSRDAGEPCWCGRCE